MADWYTKIAEQVVGPLSAEQLKSLADEGRLTPKDPVAKSRDGPWVAASRVKGLFDIAEIDDGPGGEAADTAPKPTPPATATATPKPPDAPPIPQPPVVMPAKTAEFAPAQAAEPSEAPSDPGPGGFAIQTEQAAATDRFQKKKRVKKPKEPLTKKQKNARLVKWLAVAIVAGMVVLASIPFLRKLTRSAPAPVVAENPVPADVDLAADNDSLDEAFAKSSVPARSPAASVSPAASAPPPLASSSTDVTVDMKPIQYVLDRPQMIDAAGNRLRTSNPFLLVELELSTTDPAASVRFRGWVNHADEVSLTDDRGVRYELKKPGDFRGTGMHVDKQCLDTVFLTAERPVTDVLVFAWPENDAPELPTSSDEALELRLPKSAHGQQGEWDFGIRLSDIEVTEEALEVLRSRQPEAKPGTSDNVEMDDGGPIRIPGLTD